MKKHTQQTLALAGVAQAAYLVHQLARHGLVSQDNFATTIDSLFVMNPSSTEAVYGKASRVKLGLQVLQELLQGGGGLLKHPDVMRYLLGLLYLEGKLRREPAVMGRIRAGIEEIEQRFPGPDKSADQAPVQELGRLYQDTVSTLNFRIQVKGDLEFLRNEITAGKIRAVLLAGIRSAVLWRQLGGRRWHLLFYRKRIGEDTEYLLEHYA